MNEKMTGKKKSGGLSVSIPGLLAVMTGLTILYLYWILNWSVRISGAVSRIVLLGSASLLILWGAYEIFLGSLLSFRGRRTRRRTSDDFDAPRSSRKLSILFGICLMAVGATFGTLIAMRAESGLTVIIGITIGIYAFVAGLRKLITALQFDPSHEGVRRHQHLTLPGIAYLGIMVTFMAGALIGRSNMLMLMFAWMAGPFVVNGGFTLRMLRLTTISRKLPKQAMAGEAVDVALTVENGKRWMSSSIIDVVDRISGNDEELQTGVLFARIPPRSSRTGTYRFRPMQRGRYRFGPTIVSSRFPLGFVERGLRFATRDELLVFPQLGRLTPEWERDALTATELIETENARFGVYEDEFHRLREHRWGDNPRAIHWRTSARRNELMVREYQQTRDRDLVVLLDLWIPRKPTDEDRERVELAVSFAATVCVEQMRQSRESQVTVVAAGKTTQHWQGQAGPAAFDSLLTMLALSQPGRSEPTEKLLEQAGPAHTPATRHIFITTSGDRAGDPSPGKTSSLPTVEARLETYVADWNSLGRYFQLAQATASREKSL